ncbi:MFS transporter, partial [Paenibacillus xylanivorans]
MYTGWIGSVLILMGLVSAVYAISRKEQTVQAAG